jgi:phosphatidylserine/phosphatidylglycerophosphate/cardiolipin synthase-like enzyme
VNLIVEPDDGIGPVVSAIHKAKTSIDIGIFRLDRGDVAKALRTAVARGVHVRTLIAYTNRGGDKRLRKLEQDLLKTGASVRRTDDDLRRYHNKIMIVDRAILYVLGFNYTALDIDKSRSFGVVTKKRELVRQRHFRGADRCGVLHAWPRGSSWPRELRARRWPLPQGRPTTPAGLRSQAHRPEHDPHPAGARERRRERPHPGQAGQARGGTHGREVPGQEAPRAGHRQGWAAGVRGQPGSAEAGAITGARWADRHDPVGSR